MKKNERSDQLRLKRNTLVASMTIALKELYNATETYDNKVCYFLF